MTSGAFQVIPSTPGAASAGAKANAEASIAADEFASAPGWEVVELVTWMKCWGGGIRADARRKNGSAVTMTTNNPTRASIEWRFAHSCFWSSR